jgi:P27 family predicted phage terminase small subunit
VTFSYKIGSIEIMAQRGRKSRAQLAVVPEEQAATRQQPPVFGSEPPAHLGAPEKAIWAQVVEDFALPSRASFSMLVAALEAHQRARECREAIAHDGMTVTGRDGQLKPHPLLATERDARQAFLAAFRVLGIAAQPSLPKDPGGYGVAWWQLDK